MMNFFFFFSIQWRVVPYLSIYVKREERRTRVNFVTVKKPENEMKRLFLNPAHLALSAKKPSRPYIWNGN